MGPHYTEIKGANLSQKRHQCAAETQVLRKQCSCIYDNETAMSSAGFWNWTVTLCHMSVICGGH